MLRIAAFLWLAAYHGASPHGDGALVAGAALFGVALALADAGDAHPLHDPLWVALGLVGFRAWKTFCWRGGYLARLQRTDAPLLPVLAVCLVSSSTDAGSLLRQDLYAPVCVCGAFAAATHTAADLLLSGSVDTPLAQYKDGKPADVSSRFARYLIAVVASVAVAAAPFVLLSWVDGDGSPRSPCGVAAFLKAWPALTCIWVCRKLGGRRPTFHSNCVAFALCGLGDVLLQLDDRPVVGTSGDRFPALFVPGLAAFLLGHCQFVWTFWIAGGDAPAPRATFASLAVAAAIVAMLFPVLPEGDAVLRVALPCYAAIIATMANRAFSMWQSAEPGTLARAGAGAAAAGAVIFMASDFMIAVDRFLVPLGEIRNVLVMGTYFTALSLIALSSLVGKQETRNERAPYV